jgi:hypothetical protein
VRIALLSLFVLSACAETGESACDAEEGGEVVVQDAWIREQADPDAASAAYFRVCNGATSTAVLTGVETPGAKRAEMHQSLRDARGVVSMAPLGRVEIQPGEWSVFEPGGKHVMLLDRSAPLRAGETTMLVLQFEDGSTISVEARVRSAAEAAGGEHRH